MLIPTIFASLSSTGCALLLFRRPNRRLRLLTMVVGLMSLAQTAAAIHSAGLWTGNLAYVTEIHQSLVACLSLLAIYLLGSEIYDRNRSDRKLRLRERLQTPATLTVSPQTAFIVIAKPTVVSVIPAANAKTAVHAASEPANPRFYTGPSSRTVDTLALSACESGTIALALALGESVRPAVVDLAWQEASNSR